MMPNVIFLFKGGGSLTINRLSLSSSEKFFLMSESTKIIRKSRMAAK